MCVHTCTCKGALTGWLRVRIQAYLGGGADEVTGEAAGHVELVHVRADEAVEATQNLL